MLDIAIELAWAHVFGVRPRVLGYAEREAYAASVLMARMEEQSLEPAPVFCGDFRDLDARPLRGRLRILAAGLPCQPYSTAGKQRGLKDARSWGEGDGPLPHALRIIEEAAPAVVCFENVPQWITGGAFRQFGAALCALGYEIEDPLFIRASDVGASHRRERVFILAHRASERSEFVISARSRREREGASNSERGGAVVAHGEGERWGQGRAEHELWGGRDASAGASGELADTERGGFGEQRRSRIPNNPTESRERLAELRGALFAPGPECETWARHLNEQPWLAPAAERGLCVLADGVAVALDASRADQLRCGGNGVVVGQAAASFVHLFQRLK